MVKRKTSSLPAEPLEEAPPVVMTVTRRPKPGKKRPATQRQAPPQGATVPARHPQASDAADVSITAFPSPPSPLKTGGKGRSLPPRIMFERNIARLVPILPVTKEAPDSWVRDGLVIDGNAAYNVSCRGVTGYGVPHGQDLDVMLGIVDLYSGLDMPEDGKIVVSFKELIRAAGMQDGGKTRTAVEHSLRRLRGSTFSFGESWRFMESSHGQRQQYKSIEEMSLITRFRIYEVSLDDSDPDAPINPREGPFSSRAMIEIDLSDMLSRSARNGHLVSLPTERFINLKRSQVAKMQYMFMEDFRLNYEAEHGRQEVVPLTMSSRTWRGLLGDSSNFSRDIRRAHEELVKQRVIKPPVEVRRSDHTVYHYELLNPEDLSPEEASIRTEVEEYVKTRGLPFSYQNLQGVFKTHGARAVGDAVRRFEVNERNLKGGKALVPLAVLRSILKEPWNYSLPDELPAAPAEGRAALPRPARKSDPQDVQLPEPEREERTARLMLKSTTFSKDEVDLIVGGYLAHQVSVWEITQANQDPSGAGRAMLSRLRAAPLEAAQGQA
jgi:hypothetical protein